MGKSLIFILVAIMLFTTGCDVNVNIGNSSQATEKEVSSILSELDEALSSAASEISSEMAAEDSSLADFPIFDPNSYDNYEAPSYNDEWNDYDPLADSASES